MKPLVTLAGLGFDDLDIAQAASWIAARPAEAAFGYVVTPNADHLVRVSRNPKLRAIYRGAALCLLDSRVVGWLARLMGMPAPAIAPGSDLTAHLLAHHLAPGERITIVGLSPVWLPPLIARCGLAPPAHYNPPMGLMVIRSPSRTPSLSSKQIRRDWCSWRLVRRARSISRPPLQRPAA